MADVVVNDASLLDIGNAIREKNGEQTKYKPDAMGAAIRAISGGGLPPEFSTPLNYDYTFAYGNFEWMLEKYGDKIKFIEKRFPDKPDSWEQPTMNYTFSDCHHIRKFNPEMMENNYINNAGSYIFTNCWSLDEVTDMSFSPKVEYHLNSVWGQEENFSGCFHLKDIQYDPNTEIAPAEHQQPFQLVIPYSLGHCKDYRNDMLSVGFLPEKEITDKTSYDRLKNDPDAWTAMPEYSRYNKNSFVRTINSLPTVARGELIVRYKTYSSGTDDAGILGSLTDGGAIKTVSESDIALAASKGWTVVFQGGK